MAIEIERKFLVADDSWRLQVTRVRHIRQAYLAKNDRVSVRIRLDGPTSATLTVKTAAASIARQEYEYPIDVRDAEALLEQREGSIITKTRHIVPFAGLVWEIDVFGGAHAGLVVAEVELENADQRISRPPWLGREVTSDRRYSNAELSAGALANADDILA